MKERRREFFCFFSGISLIRCIEFLRSPCDFGLIAMLSDFLLDKLSALSSSPPPPDFLINGRFADSLSARGRLTACTNSDTEEVAFSF